MKVEQSQTQWLTANQDLSYELEKALYQNKCLKSEIAKLKEQQQRVQQRGDLPPEIARVLLNAPSCASIPEEGEGEENSEEEEEEVWAEAVFGLDNGPQQQQQEHSEPAGMVPGRGMLRTKQVFVESPDSDTSDSDEEA